MRMGRKWGALVGAAMLPGFAATANGQSIALSPNAETRFSPDGAISPLAYGAKCDGSTDDTAAFQAAIDALPSGQGGLIEAPPLSCLVNGSLAISKNNVNLRGAGIGATVITFGGGGSANGFVIGTQPSAGNCVGSSAPPDCRQTFGGTISNMTVQAPSRTGGALFNVNGATQFHIWNVFYNGWDLLASQYTNTLMLEDVNGSTNDTSGYSISVTNPITSGTAAGWYRTDAPTFYNVTVNALSKNAVGGCLNLDGMVATVRLHSVALLNCGYGLNVSNSALSTRFFPQFLETFDLEVDGASQQGVNIDAGNELKFHNCDVNVKFATTPGHYPLKISPDYGFSFTRGVSSNGCNWHDGPDSAAYINGLDIVLSGDQLYDTNHVGTGTSPTVLIDGANTDNIQITGSLVGSKFGDPNFPNYGVEVTSAVVGAVSLTGDDYTTATLGNFLNNSSTVQGFVGGISRGHQAITVTSCGAHSAC